MNFFDDLFIILGVFLTQLGVRLAVTFIDEVYWKPIVILNGRKFSVEFIARTYEAMDFVMGDLMKTYEGGELRDAVRHRLEKLTGTEWDEETTQAWLDNFQEDKMKERVEAVEKVK